MTTKTRSKKDNNPLTPNLSKQGSIRRDTLLHRKNKQRVQQLESIRQHTKEMQQADIAFVKIDALINQLPPVTYVYTRHRDGALKAADAKRARKAEKV